MINYTWTIAALECATDEETNWIYKELNAKNLELEERLIKLEKLLTTGW